MTRQWYKDTNGKNNGGSVNCKCISVSLQVQLLKQSTELNTDHMFCIVF